MKTTLFSLSTLLILSVLFFLPSSFAQKYTQWGLPEGAKLRLGKGSVGAAQYSPYMREGSMDNMQYSPDGKLLAVASSIGVWLYDTETYQELALLTGHTRLVSSVCFSPDGRILASGSWDETVKLWDVATGTLQRTLNSFGSVTGVHFSPDGRTLAVESSSEDFWGIALLDVSTGTPRAWLGDDVLSMDFSPDGQTLATSDVDDKVRLWDVATGTLLRTFKGHTDTRYRVHANSVRFSADGETLVSAASRTETRRYMNKLYLIRQWDVASGEPLKEIIVSTDTVSSVCWSPDGQTLARGNLDGTIRLWDVTTGEPVKMLIAHTDVVTSLCWSPNGQTLASASQDGTIRLWDVGTGLPRHTFTGHTSRASSMDWSFDKQTLIYSNYADGKVWLWDVETGIPRPTFPFRIDEEGRSLSLSADGQMLAIASDDTTIRLWDVATDTLRYTLPGHTRDVSSLCFSADRQMLASGSWDIRLWDVATGASLKTLGRPTGSIGFVRSMAFSPDRQTLASGHILDSKDYVIRLWDVTRGILHHTLTGHTGEILNLCFSPDGQTLASGNGLSWWTELGITEHTIQLWDVATGEHQKTFTGHVGSVESLCWSPDGQTLASGGGHTGGEPGWTDYKVRVWDVATGELRRTLIGHTDEVLSVRFSADGQTLASGSADGTVLLWEMNPDALSEKK